jgi:hypothetical protein
VVDAPVQQSGVDLGGRPVHELVSIKEVAHLSTFLLGEGATLHAAELPAGTLHRGVRLRR